MRLLLPILIIVAVSLAGCSSYPAPVVSRQQPSSIRIDTHRVEPGETLYSIAWRYDLTVKKLTEINQLQRPYIINPGQILTIHPGSSVAKKPSESVPKTANSTTIARPQSAISKDKPIQKVLTPKPPSKGVALPWDSPVEGKIVEDYNPQQLRKGLTFKAAGGSSVNAVADGVVVYAGDGLRDYGNLIIVKHSEKLLSAYGHNQRLLVKEGDTVDHRQAIAKLGAEGILYFEIRRDGDPVNPQGYLK